jgi:hypothetical protein
MYAPRQQPLGEDQTMNTMQTPDEILTRWQPAPNSKMSLWIQTLNGLEQELTQLQELREQRTQEREVLVREMKRTVVSIEQKKNQQLLGQVVLLDRVIGHIDAEIAKLREQECQLELTLNAAADRLTASSERLHDHLYYILQNAHLDRFDLSSLMVYEEGLRELVAGHHSRSRILH